MARTLTTIIMTIITALFCACTVYLPVIGDANSAPNQHVTPYYIEHSAEDTGSPNIVTGTLADYRGYDTLWETSVMFVSGLTACLILMKNTGEAGRPDRVVKQTNAKKGGKRREK